MCSIYSWKQVADIRLSEACFQWASKQDPTGQEWATEAGKPQSAASHARAHGHAEYIYIRMQFYKSALMIARQ